MIEQSAGEMVMLDIQAISNYARQSLSEERWQHTCGVVEAARLLARQHGLDEERAVTAAWIHDAAREWPVERLLAAAEEIEVPAGFAQVPILLHGPVAASILQNQFDCDDQEILDAIRHHTTGRLEMTELDKVLCLADAIEPGRRYPGVDDIRECAQSSLDRALAMSFDSTLQYLIARHQPIFPLTVMARNNLWETLQTRTN